MIHDLVSTFHAATSFVASVVSDLQDAVDVLPPVLQFFAVFLLSVIPVVEGDIAAGIGMVAGVAWEFTLLAATAGTALASWGGAVWGSRIAGRRRGRAAVAAEDAGAGADVVDDDSDGTAGSVDGAEDADTAVPSRRRDAARRLLARVDRYGLGPAMVLGGFVSPVAVNTFVLAVAGLDRRRLVFWGVVSSVVNVGVVVAGATGVLHLLLH